MAQGWEESDRNSCLLIYDNSIEAQHRKLSLIKIYQKKNWHKETVLDNNHANSKTRSSSFRIETLQSTSSNIKVNAWK